MCVVWREKLRLERGEIVLFIARREAACCRRSRRSGMWSPEPKKTACASPGSEKMTCVSPREEAYVRLRMCVSRRMKLRSERGEMASFSVDKEATF
ncbi:hypothetical protein GUJ93_ZPchr0092g38066 [Zizania palustris]|uniref:Uncharacterized protein n=1 Tax=Zizania palustris TaxID=103762 RepID=A0A8J5R6A9_ZIZPA|nr:hypothetical protein GUJ93_ZPchr0092g38066 [Zizania palustris]